MSQLARELIERFEAQEKLFSRPARNQNAGKKRAKAYELEKLWPEDKNFERLKT